MDAVVRLIEKLEEDYSIDKSHIYTTGQSMGCMTSLYLNSKYPDLFAASLFVSGQWDILALKPLEGKKFFYITAGGDEKASGGQREVISQLILSKKSDQERAAVSQMIAGMAEKILTATVSYVGKADYKEAEKYIRDFRTWTNATGNYILIEISAVNGKFNLDFIQPFKSPVYMNAFLKELEENGITYDLQDVMKLELPDIKLPWR